MKKLIILTLIAGILAVGLWLGWPAYRSKKESLFASQAREALAKGESRRALLSARQALLLNSNNIVACGVMADLADTGRSPQAIVWRRQIATLQPTLENETALAACALRYEQPPFSLTAEILKRIEDRAKEFTPFHTTSAHLALRLNQFSEAESHFEEAIRLEPTNNIHRMNLAVVQLKTGDAAKSAAARTRLEELQNDKERGMDALRSLTAFDFGRGAHREARDYSSRLLQRRESVFSDKLQHLALLHQLKDVEFNDFLEALRNEAGTNAVMTYELAAQLVNFGKASDALAWIKRLPKTLQDEQPVPIAIVSCLSAGESWQALEEYLNAQNWGERDFLRCAFLAKAVRNQNGLAVARIHWGRAIDLVSGRSELLGVLAQTAREWGWHAETEQVLWRIAKAFTQERWALNSLLRDYQAQQNTRGLYEVHAVLVDRESPNALFVQNNFAALALLLGTNTARAHELAKRVYETDTNNSACVSTYAYSLYLQGKVSEALKLMESLPEAQLEDPALAGYYGAMLVADGQKEKAGRFLAKGDNLNLLPEERKLVADARRDL